MLVLVRKKPGQPRANVVLGRFATKRK